MPAALDALHADSTVTGWFAPVFVETFVGLKRHEIERLAGLDPAGGLRPLPDALLMAAQLENGILPKGWPAAVEVLNEDGRSDIVLLCEHASNHMPGEYGQLGLDASHLQRHIAWDIGAAEVTRHLSAIARCAGLPQRLFAGC